MEEHSVKQELLNCIDAMKQLRIILILSCVLVTMVACKDRNKVDDNGNNYGSSTFKLGSLYYSFIGSDDVSVVAPPDYTPYSITYVSIDETIAYKNRTYYVWRIEHDAFAFDSNLITANTGEVRYIDDIFALLEPQVLYCSGAKRQRFELALYCKFPGEKNTVSVCPIENP